MRRIQGKGAGGSCMAWAPPAGPQSCQARPEGAGRLGSGWPGGQRRSRAELQFRPPCLGLWSRQVTGSPAH